MFPLNSNDQYIDSNGKRSKLGDAIGSGGGGGSTISITPVLTEGTKIADFEIDGDEGSLYAPAGGGGGSDLYLDVETNCNLTKDSWQMNYFDTSSLTGKTITSWVVQHAPNNSAYFVAPGMMSPGGQTGMLIYTTQGSSPKKITIRFYYK